MFEAGDVPYSGQLHRSYIVDYVYDLYPLPEPDVGTFVLVCDMEHV